MKALAISDFETTPAVVDLPMPEPGAGQVRLRVHAAGLNRIDTMVAAGMMQGMAEYRFPVVLGRDAAGVIDAVGDGVTGLRVGDEVIAHVTFDGILSQGTIAEYVAVSAGAVAPKPGNVDAVTAAAVPLAAAAAHQVVEAADPAEGAAVLITGGSGGVGSFAIQLAVGRGATVVTTGLPEDADRLRALGAHLVVDYTRDVAAQVRAARPEGVDALIDLVSWSPEGIGELAGLVRPGGRVVSSLNAADPDALAARGLVGVNLAADPSAERLSAIVGEIERGALRIDVEEVLPFHAAGDGLAKLGNGEARGKIVVQVP